MTLEVVALIPARGQSKSLPRKNLRPLGEHPLIAYSVAAALQAKLVNRVIVSTDDHEIADVALRYGAEVPFIRPAELAQDETVDLPVFAHALSWMSAHDYEPDLLVQLRPTSPFRPEGFVDEGIAMATADSTVDCVRSVTEARETPYKMWRERDDALLDPLLPDVPRAHDMRRQDLPRVLWQTGHLDVVRPRTIREGSMSGRRIRGLEIDPAYLVDIDTALDWRDAQWKFDALELPMVRP